MNPLLSYLGILLLAGVILYRSFSYKIELRLSRHRPMQCSECFADTTDDCIFCGAIRNRIAQQGKLAGTFRALLFLAVASIIYLLTVLNSQNPGLGLDNAWKFYSGLFMRIVHNNAEVFLALAGLVAVSTVTYYARRVDRKFEGFADFLLESPGSLVVFESFRRAQRLKRTARGRDAFSIARSLVPEVSAGKFKEATLKLQEIGLIEPAYAVRNGSILRRWKANSP